MKSNEKRKDEKTMGKYHTISHGINARINDCIKLGTKREEMQKACKEAYIEKNGSADGWDNKFSRKNDYIRSAKSIDTLRTAGNRFINWAKSQEVPITKYEKITRETLEKYLVERSMETKVMANGQIRETSAWTISSDLHFCNKILIQDERLKMEKPLTKRELGLKSRCDSDVTRGRTVTKELGIPDNRPGLVNSYKDETIMCLGTGCRRESIPQLTVERFRFDESGQPTEVFLIEKNGKERWAPVREEFKEPIKEIIDRPRDNPNEPFFTKFGKNVVHQQFRRDWAKSMIETLQAERDRGEPPRFEYKITAKERAMYPNGFMGYSLEAAAQLSQILGHNRIDVLKSYILEGR